LGTFSCGRTVPSARPAWSLSLNLCERVTAGGSVLAADDVMATRRTETYS
jgi:hypothetical protein